MHHTPDQQAAVALDFRQLACRLIGVEPMEIAATSSPSAVSLMVAGRRLVVKMAAPHRPGTALLEAWAYRACRRRRVRTPEVVAVSTAPECIIIEALPGQSLWSDARNRADDRNIWTQVGADLRSMHEIRLDGFGPLVGSGNGDPRGESDRWCPWVRSARAEGIQHLVQAGYISLQTAQGWERRYDAAARVLNNWTDGRLLHGDFEGGHMLGTSTGTYSGVIDFSLAQAGDPRWDLARVLLWDGQAALDAVLDGYGHDALSKDDRTTVLPLYVLAFVIHQAVPFDRCGRRDAVREHLHQVGYDEGAGD